MATVTVRVVMKAADDNPNLRAVTYGRVVWIERSPVSGCTRTTGCSVSNTVEASGDYGRTGLSSAPAPSSSTLQRTGNGATHHRRRLRYGSGAVFRVRCANGGRVLGPGGTSQGAQVVLADDNGSNNNLWRFL
ncbi:hypothetical protein AB0J35_00825 [Nonomuraea angiospora]|uniref:RICIN domain-containing protein n=1 Tax=Nonomuraea angiospora TaxID=46172 RepID=UPI00341B2F83